jgi:hypothetical protein
MLKYNPTRFTKPGPGQTVWTPRSNRPGDVEIFRKPYLSHPDYELDVLYMDLDLLDRSYPIGKSKLPFKDFGQGGLTGLTQTCHFLVSTLLFSYPLSSC